jgi:hypothetical protein
MHIFINNIKNNFIYVEKIFNNNNITNFEKKIESLLNHTNFSLYYFKESITEENLNYSNDILNGFYFKKQNVCLYVEHIYFSKKMFLLFSFNFMGEDKNKTYTIFEFYKIQKSKIYFSFVVKYSIKDEKYKFYIEKYDNKTIDTNIEIKKNINYFLKICIDDKKNEIIYFEDNEINQREIQKFLNIENNYTIYIGSKLNKDFEISQTNTENYLNNKFIDTFEGKIGTIILSGKNSIFKDKFDQKYENIFLNENCKEEIYKNLYLLISSKSFEKSLNICRFENIFSNIDYDKKIEKNNYYKYENFYDQFNELLPYI